MPLTEAFTFDHVVVERDGRRLLDGVSDHIHAAAVTAVIGPSGSGKTTFLRLLNRFEDPSSGTILFFDEPIEGLDVHDLRRRVGLLAQRPVMLTGTVADEVAVAAPTLGADDRQALLARVGLGEVPLDRAPRSLSGGEQQRLALARALAVQPDVLLLDEPTSALDGVAAALVDAVIGSLVADGLTVVLVSHDLGRVAGVADHVLVLDSGRLVERGYPDDVEYLG